MLNIAMVGKPVICKISLTTEDNLAIISQIKAQLIAGIKPWEKYE